jgi:hypothetical protein
MCCVDPKKYFGGYCNRIAESLAADAKPPYLDGAPDSSTAGPRAQLSSKDLVNLQLESHRIQ